MNHGLTEGTIRQITDVLKHFPQVEKATLFGSRAKGTYRPGSDIDLALVGASLDWVVIGQIYDALDDLYLPYRFSLIQFDGNTDPEVSAHILRVGIVLFERDSIQTKAMALTEAL